MKAVYTLLPDFAQSRMPFLVKRTAAPFFSREFHFHEQCQLVYVLSGSGTRIVSQSIESYQEGDLIFIGSNVPHVWCSDTSGSGRESVSVALYIDPDLITEKLSGLIDVEGMRDFFKHSERGIKICGAKKVLMTEILEQMPSQQSFKLLESFIKIMDQLLDSNDLLWLNSPDIFAPYSNEPPGRVRRLMNYIQENFKDEVTLQKAASISGLQLHAFCRFFKTLTNRTFSDFINETRISYARKLLAETKLPVAQIAYECGYMSICYFNRSFKKVTQISPKDYRAMIWKGARRETVFVSNN